MENGMQALCYEDPFSRPPGRSQDPHICIFSQRPHFHPPKPFYTGTLHSLCVLKFIGQYFEIFFLAEFHLSCKSDC